MQSFHLVMADAYHPYKDSSNLAPARSLAKELMEQASIWSEAPLPEKVSTEEMKTKLSELKDGTWNLVNMNIENAPDSVFAARLVELHDVFHKIQEGWYGAGKEGEDHDHH